jgi:hypothetical protein
LSIGLAAGLVVESATPVYAACGSANGVICSGPKASLVEVDHVNVDPMSVLERVEPPTAT